MYDKNIKKLIIRLKKKGVSHSTIVKHFNIPKSTISTWLKGVDYTKSKICKKRYEKLGRSSSERARCKRLLYQQKGVEQAKLQEPLHISGCMLYWAEGQKSRNSLSFSNSDLDMMIKFKQFLDYYFNPDINKYRFCIQAYLQNGLTETDIINYWLKNLFLSNENLRSCRFDIPKTNCRSNNILLYGTGYLNLGRVDVVQHIYGAIGEYANLDSTKWLE